MASFLRVLQGYTIGLGQQDLTIFSYLQIIRKRMYGHPPPGMQNQKIRYSTQPQQSYPAYPQPVMSNSQYNTQNAYHQASGHPQAQHYQMSNAQMYQNPNAMRNNSQASSYRQQQQYMNANAALIQPPALNVEQSIETNSQFFPPRQPMTMSNNQHSEFDNMHHQQQEQMSNEAQIACMFWQQRCMTMLQRFEWFYERFQILSDEYMGLTKEMQKMDSQEQWHNFQQHHDEFHQKIMQMQQELSAVLAQNDQLLQQKQVQEGQSVWEQRYQQLLGNFKSLQEELNHMQNGGSQINGVPPEQYEHLQSQFEQLEYQYNQVMQELDNYRGAEMHINQYLEQIENYKQKLQGFHNENVEMQQMILELQEKNKRLEHGYENAVERQKYEELAYIIEQKEREIQQLQHDFKTKGVNQPSISQYEAALASKNGEIQTLKQKLSQKDKEISLGIIKLQSVEGSLRNTLNSEFQNQRHQMERRIVQLQKMIDDMKKQSIRSSSQAGKTEVLQRKIENLNTEVANLNDTLKKKNQQLNQLRSMSYEYDRLKENESNYNKVLEEKSKLSELLKKKNAQIETIHLEVERLTAKMNEVSNKKQEYSTRNLMIEIEDLTDQLRRYEGEINKLKNIIELKEEYTQKIQSEIRLINEKYISTEQILLNERENWKETEIKLSSKNLEHQKRIKNLDYEFNLQLKENLEKEVIALRKQNVQKQESIRAMQEKQLLLSSQIAVFQKLKNNFDRDISLLRKKEKQLQSLNEAQSRRFKQLEAAYLAKQNDVDQLKMNQVSMSSQLTALKTQIDDCNSLIKTKNKTIQNLQTEVKQQLGRTQLVDQLMNQNGKLKIALKSAQQQLQRLKFTSQSRLVLSRAHSRKDLQKEQRNLINQLQQQNSYLKIEISKMLQKQTSSKSIPHQSVPISPQSKLVSVDLNKRLSEFNFKLQHTINEPKGTLAHSKSQKVIEIWESERRQLIDRYEQEIAKLKQQINQRQANRIHVTQKTQQSNISQSPRKQAYTHLQSEQLREEILFFRQKHKEQEERNQTLVKINEELRSKLDSALKIRQGVNTSDYYKEQIKLLQNENELLKNKSKKLFEENKDIKIQLSNKNSKLSKDYELKILELQLTIQELKRKVSYLNAEKASANNERASIQHNQNNYNISSYDREVYQPKTYKAQTYKTQKYTQKYYQYLPQSPKNIEQQFQSVLGNLRGNPSPKNQQSYGPISQISSNTYTYNDSRINPVRSRMQK